MTEPGGQNQINKIPGEGQVVIKTGLTHENTLAFSDGFGEFADGHYTRSKSRPFEADRIEGSHGGKAARWTKD